MFARISTIEKPRPCEPAGSLIAALHVEVEGMLAVEVDRAALERACEALLRELPQLGVALLREPDGIARVVLAWQLADRLLLTTDRPARAVEVAPRVGHALAEVLARRTSG